MILSKIFDTMSRTLAGLSFSFSKGLFFLKTGVISANFNLSGKLPVLKIPLKSFCKTGAVELVHFLRIFAGISFLVPDFFEFKERISLSTSSVFEFCE